MKGPAAATASDCPGFDWLRARDARCDQCGRRPWQHDHMMTLLGAAGDRLVPRPWRLTIIDDWTDRRHIDASRARYLADLHGNPAATR